VEVSDAELGLRRDDHADDVDIDDDDDGGGGVGAAAASRSGMAAISTFRAVSVTGPAIYYLGIVDFLQDWTTNKKIERNFKIYALRKDPDGLSVMHPETYKLRFQAKMEQIFDTEGPPAAMGRSWSSSNARALADLATAAAQEEGSEDAVAAQQGGSGDVVTTNRKQEDPEADADGTMNPLQQHDEKKR
jgi:hypothetical protein